MGLLRQDFGRPRIHAQSSIWELATPELQRGVAEEVGFEPTGRLRVRV